MEIIYIYIEIRVDVTCFLALIKNILNVSKNFLYIKTFTFVPAFKETFSIALACLTNVSTIE